MEDDASDGVGTTSTKACRGVRDEVESASDSCEWFEEEDEEEAVVGKVMFG